MSITKTLHDKSLGSLLGGAIGDALGFPIEFVHSFAEISRRFGPDGLTGYILTPDGEALISDDTQMTLYTIEGIAAATERHCHPIDGIRDSYIDWYHGPPGTSGPSGTSHSRLLTIPEFNQRRAPGLTCMSALRALVDRSPVDNDSKGCGGVMRVAPVGIFGAVNTLPPDETARLAAQTAHITHLHPLSDMVSAMAAVLIQLCLEAHYNLTRDEFETLVRRSLQVIASQFEDAPYLSQFTDIILHSLSLADDERNDWEIIENDLGGGWVAEETLAIALFCVARHIDNIREALLAAVNHGGDSDSTGAVTGNIIGAITGAAAIPADLLRPLQFNELISTMHQVLIEQKNG